MRSPYWPWRSPKILTGADSRISGGCPSTIACACAHSCSTSASRVNGNARSANLLEDGGWGRPSTPCTLPSQSTFTQSHAWLAYTGRTTRTSAGVLSVSPPAHLPPPAMRLAPRQHSSEILDAGLCLDGSAEGLPPARASLRAPSCRSARWWATWWSRPHGVGGRAGALAAPLDAVLTPPLVLDLEWPPRWAACNRAGSGDALVSVHATLVRAAGRRARRRAGGRAVLRLWPNGSGEAVASACAVTALRADAGEPSPPRSPPTTAASTAATPRRCAACAGSR